MELKSIRVRIYGSDYPLKVDDENLSHQSAEYIDKMMWDLHTKLPDQPASTLAILSALNISESMVHEQQSTNDHLQKLGSEINKISNFLDDILTMK
jgi:cell division protein ZapA (FtsZ GTPase activity inhibitor)